MNAVIGHEINIQKLVSNLYTKNEEAEKEFKKTIPFTAVSKRVKYLGINITEAVKDLYNKN